MDLLAALQGRVTFVVGSQKNAGKTTFVNYAARCLRERGAVGLASVGVDGEARDLLFGHPKPCVPVEPGDFVLTTDSALRSSRALFRVHDAFATSTALGRLVVARCLRGDVVELVGPETNSQLAEMLGVMQSLGAETVLVDGAVNRVTQAAAQASATGPEVSIVDVVRLTPSTVRSVEERLKMLSLILEMKEAPSDVLSRSEWVHISGAVTQSKLSRLPKGMSALVIDDFTSLFVESSALAALGVPVWVKRRFRHAAVVLNAFDVDVSEFVANSRMSDEVRALLVQNPCLEVRT